MDALYPLLIWVLLGILVVGVVVWLLVIPMLFGS